MNLLVTGGLGFIASNFIRYMLNKYSDVRITNVDHLTIGSSPRNLEDMEKDRRYRFVRRSIGNFKLISKIAKDVHMIVNAAAETHVDRSISNPKSFLETNTVAVLGLLQICRLHEISFLQISTDEVYGSALHRQVFVEDDRLEPSSPYAASKGAADLFVEAYRKTYGLRTFITRSTNNFGPYQHPEKFIPKIIVRAELGLPVPVYGSGRQVRDWIHVVDHCESLDLVIRKGRPGETYNIAGGNQLENLEVAERILDIMGKPKSMIEHVEDRPGHDLRYSLDGSKIRRELGWNPRHNFEKSLEETVNWYRENSSWWRPLINSKILSPTPWKEKW